MPALPPDTDTRFAGDIGDIPDAVIDEAVDWAVQLDFNKAGAAARQAFQAWHDASPAHALAWQRVRSLGQDLARVPCELALETLERADAKRHARRAGRRQALGLLALTGMAAATGWIVRDHTPWQRLCADVSSRVGEQRRMRLDDGTEVILNTDSALDIVFSPEQRLLDLRRGEILIATGHDARFPAKRPFRVRTPFGTLQALGTRFNVRLEDDSARLGMLEGTVRLQPAGGGQSPVAAAGEIWRLYRTHAAPAQPHGFREDGWVDGVITATDMRLADLLDELARYRVGHIACDPRIADLRVSGIYQIHDTDRVLRFLAQAHSLRLAYYTRYWISVAPA